MLPFADPIMSLRKAKRVQLFEPDGTETHAQDPRWAFMAKANVTDKEPAHEDAEDPQQAEKPTLPWRALEAIQSAKVRHLKTCNCHVLAAKACYRLFCVRRLRLQGEVDVILDLVELVRQQQALAATNVQKPRTTVADLAAEHALRAQSKIQQLRVGIQQGHGRSPGTCR